METQVRRDEKQWVRVNSDVGYFGSDAETEDVFQHNVEADQEYQTSKMPQLKIIAKAADLPGASLLATVTKPFLGPLQSVADKALLPLGSKIVHLLDSRVPDGSKQWILTTQEKLMTIIETSDDIACNCLDKVIVKRRVTTEETIVKV